MAAVELNLKPDRATLRQFGWIALAVVTFPIGFTLSYLIMGVLFFGIITPAGLLLRWSGKDPLERRWDPEAESYWVDSREPRPKSDYFKQF